MEHFTLRNKFLPLKRGDCFIQDAFMTGLPVFMISVLNGERWFNSWSDSDEKWYT